MPRVRRRPFPLIAGLLRLLALLVWGGQLGITTAPLIDAHVAPAAGAHAEAEGLTRHAAHAPDQCWACAAHAIVATPAVPRAGGATIARPRWTPSSADPVAAAGRRLVADRPRAPPVRESEC